MSRTQPIRNTAARRTLALAVALATPALAQESGMLEEIIVTAEHREVSLQDTQISISAFDSQTIEDMGIRSTVDLGQAAPNLVINSLQGGKSGVAINMRGIGQNETLAAYDPAVGLYIDDVLIAKSVGAVIDILDIERVEILRGPQGTLYGRNTMGGTVNFVSKKPVDTFEGRITATLGDYGQQDLVGVLNVPLMSADSGLGALNLRVTAASIERDGLTDNDYRGESSYNPPLFYDGDLYGKGGDDNPALRKVNRELETKDRDVIFMHLGWEPTDDLSLLYTYDRTRIDEVPGTPWTTAVNLETSAGNLLVPYNIGRGADRPDSIAVDGAHLAETEVDGHSLQLDYAINDSLTIKSITAQREMDNFATADSDGSPLSIIQTVDYNSTEQFTQEFRLTGDVMDNRLSFTTGLFYMNEEGDVDSRVDVFALAGPIPGPSRNIGDFENESWAIYGQATYAINEQWSVTVGARYTDEEREMSKVYRPSALDKLQRGYPDEIDFGTTKGDFDNFSPMASVSYYLDDDIMTYFKVSTGFQSGGFNIRDVNIGETSPGVFEPTSFDKGFDEETMIAYELGMKADFLDRFRVNAALWFSDYEDKVLSNFDPQTLSNNLQNAGEVDIYGLELEVLAQLSEAIQLGLYYGLQKPEYKKYDSLQPDPDNPGDFITVDLTDTNFVYSPENSVGTFLSYERDVGFGLFRARADWSWKDDYFFMGDSNGQESYSIWNARASLEEIALVGDTTLRVSVWGKNLGDESYYFNGVDIFNSFGFDINLYAEPRTYGVDLEVSF